MANMLTHAPPHLCYHAEFGRSRSNAVGKIGKGIPEKVRELRTPLWMGQGWPVRNTPRPTWVTMLNLITFGQTVWVEISQKNKPVTSRLSAFQWNSKSSELTRISSDQSGNYLLLVTHNNMGLSIPFPTYSECWPKIVNFSYPMYLLPADGVLVRIW